MLRKSFYSCFAFAFAVVLATSAFWSMATSAALAQGDEGARVWTDSSGKYKITATLEAQEGDKVKLRTDKGKLIAMPIAQLSDDDQKYLKALNGEAPEEEAEDVAEPQEESVPEDEDDFFAIKGKTIQKEGVAWKVYVGSFDKVKKVNAVSSARAWKVEPKKKNGPTANVHAVGCDMFASDVPLQALYAKDSTFYVHYASHSGNSDEKDRRLARCDAATGSHAVAKLAFGSVRLLDVSRSGKLALFLIMPKTEKYSGQGAFLAITDVGSFKNGETIEPLAVFCPYYKPTKSQVMPDSFDNVETAFFVDADHVFTKCMTAATLWNIKTCRAEYLITCEGETLAVDPTHKYFILANPNGLAFYDVLTGAPLGYVPLPNGGSNVRLFQSSFAFSPDGKKLAILRNFYVDVVDLTTGKAGSRFWAPSGWLSGTGGISWASDSSHILNGIYCYDVSTGIPIALYNGLPENPALRVSIGDYVWAVCQGILTPLKLPHAEALAAVKGKTAPELFDLYPGAEVSIKCEFNGLLNESQAIDLVKKELSNVGLKYASDAKTTILLTAKDTGKMSKTPVNGVVREQISEFTSFDRTTRIDIVDLKVFEQTFSIQKDGKDFLSDGILTTGPSEFKRESGESLEQAALRNNAPDLEYYSSIIIPPYASKGKAERAATRANVSSAGVEPIAP